MSQENEKWTPHSHTALKYHWCKKKKKMGILFQGAPKTPNENCVLNWQLYFKCELSKLNESNEPQGKIM